MGEWQPIEAAPKDGATILLSDGSHFAAGCWAFHIEPDWQYFGWEETPNGRRIIGPRYHERVPNPNAGKRHEWWNLFGCSAFDPDTQTEDCDGPINFEPTHWMPLPGPPNARKIK